MLALQLTTNKSSDLPEQKRSSWPISFGQMEHIWTYCFRSLGLTRQLLNAGLKSCYQWTLVLRNQEGKVLNVITRIKIFSIISVPFGVVSVRDTAQKVFKNYQNHDREGLALSTLSLVVVSSDVVDSFSTFLNATLTTLSSTPIEFLSTIGTPLAFIMLGFGSVSRSIQLVKTHRVYNALQPYSQMTENTLEQQKTLNSWIKMKLENKDAFLRAAPEKSVNALVNLQQEIDSSSYTEEQFQKAVEEIVKILQQLSDKMIVDIGSLIANALAITALLLFFVTAPPALPFILLAVSYALRIALLGYQDITV